MVVVPESLNTISKFYRQPDTWWFGVCASSKGRMINIDRGDVYVTPVNYPTRTY